MKVLGIDIGGSGIKSAIVETAKGKLLTERHRIETPKGAPKEGVRNALIDTIKHFNWDGPVGCGFPAVVLDNKILTASNIEKEWINTDIIQFFEKKISNPLYVLNDADAAALAEMRFGNGKNKNGVILLLTVGTGIGSALFCNKILLPNLELGQLLLKNGMIAEKYCSAHSREVEQLKLKEWAERFNKYLMLLESYINPDTIIIGGGISRKFEKFAPHLTTRAEVLPALFENNAGITGAALYASKMSKK